MPKEICQIAKDDFPAKVFIAETCRTEVILHKIIAKGDLPERVDLAYILFAKRRFALAKVSSCTLIVRISVQKR